MTQTNDNTISRKGKHLFYAGRNQLMAYKKVNYSHRTIAKLLDRAPQTINGEAKRGTVKQLKREKHGKKTTLKDILDVYFAHPYASWERGTNENQHKMIRRFIAKGKPISEVSEAQCLRIQQWMNDYPRKILGYQTPHECFVKEFKKERMAA